MPAAADPSVRPGPDAECPCAWVPARSLRECCGPLVLHGVLAPTPEALMRSRYTAFCYATPTTSGAPGIRARARLRSATSTA